MTSVYQFSITDEVNVQTGDRIGWMFEGSLGLISFDYSAGHRTFSYVGSIPQAGQNISFDNVFVPSVFSISVHIDLSKCFDSDLLIFSFLTTHGFLNSFFWRYFMSYGQSYNKSSMTPLVYPDSPHLIFSSMLVTSFQFNSMPTVTYKLSCWDAQRTEINMINVTQVGTSGKMWVFNLTLKVFNESSGSRKCTGRAFQAADRAKKTGMVELLPQMICMVELLPQMIGMVELLQMTGMEEFLPQMNGMVELLPQMTGMVELLP